MSLTPLQISQLNDASKRVSSGTASETDKKNVTYATNTFGYKPPVQTEAEYKAQLTQELPKIPAIAAIVNHGSTLDQVVNAAQTGDFSGITDSAGMPFSVADQQAALSQATEDTKASYEAQQAKDQADAENALAQKQADYQDYLINSGEQFQTDKTNLDQTAANNGVLFSGGRVQKENKLQQGYAQDQASKQGTYGRDIAQTANDFQYKYGNDAANNLSKYYQLGSNTYNPSVAQGGVTSNGLSTIYNPNQYTFQGTQKVAQKAAANTRAAGLLWNKGNKLVATGNTNQY